MVFFEVIINSQSSTGVGRDEWVDVTTTETLVEYKLEDIRVRGGNWLTYLCHSSFMSTNPSTDFHLLPSTFLFYPLPGKDGLCLPAPGEDPPGPVCTAGLWGEGPLPSRGQPVAGVLLVLSQPACHARRCCHSNLHTATPVWWHKAGLHIAPTETFLQPRGCITWMCSHFESLNQNPERTCLGSWI